MTWDRPLSAGRIAQALNLGIDQGGSRPIDDAIDELNDVYERTGRSFRIERVAGGFRIMTRPEFGPIIAPFHAERESSRLSQAAIETLAIIAYRQPVTRSDVEAIRGVGCGEILRSLLERRLLKITGRADEVGRPMLYGTSRSFLEVFGLGSIKDLPDAKELRAP